MEERNAPLTYSLQPTVYSLTAILLCGIALMPGGALGQETQSPGRGAALNITRFGEITKWDADGKDYGVIWEDPREIHRVAVTFAEPVSEAPELQYWQSSWPNRRIPRDEPSGSGSSGWLNVGDWIQGEWKTADVEVAAKDATLVYTFRPITQKEFPDIKNFDASYRTTFKLRLVGKEPLKEIRTFEVNTDSEWKPIDVEILWGGTAKEPETWDGRLEAFNGEIEAVEPISESSRVKVAADRTWKSEVRGATDGIRARLLYAETKHYNSFDETVITVRTARETFSFSPKDLLQWGHILLPDFGVLVRQAGKDVSYESALEATRAPKEKDIYTRVFDMPEQTFPRAWGDVPVKGRHYIPLSFEGGRQHFGLDGDCSVYCVKNWITQIHGKDTDRCLWSDQRISYHFGLPATGIVDRQLVDGCLPMTVSAWEHNGVRYRQTAFAVPLAGVPAQGQRILADDTLVLMVRFEMEPLPGAREAEARLVLSSADGARQETLTVDGDRLCVAQTQPERLRMLVSDPEKVKIENKSAVYSAKLSDATPKRTLDIAIPYITLTPDDAEDLNKLRALRFDDSFTAVREYWRNRIADGTQIRTPEPMINEFYRAHVSHLLINCEREVGGSDRYMAKVGTFHYGMYANESCMMVSDLDRRGYHDRVAQVLETWLHYQGARPLPGDYTSAEGEFYSAGGYEDNNGYNQHHGWVLWCLGEHYWHTRDAAWLDHAAPSIVKACDWITNQRRRTIEEAERSPIRAIERGLLPPGSLEDIADWRSWMSNNNFSWWGMANAAAALVAAGHPEGKRLSEEAEAYKKDIWADFSEAMRRSPVVRLRDGTWIPHIPSDVHRRGRSFGWITETLEGAIYLVRTGLLEPSSREANWIIRDYEDNLYISEQYGYEMKGDDFEKYWFNRGGISQQANLLGNPIPYLLRDEIPHFLRAYFNAFAVSFFPDTRMMTEHALPNIGDFRGDHYKSSDESNSTYWLRLMFIEERGEDLLLGGAIPRYWLADGQEIGIDNASTYFGPMSMKMTSHVGDGSIAMSIDPPRRNPPKRVFARFRHPDGARIARCEVNGSPCAAFDAGKEWVELTGLESPTQVVVFYK